MATCLRCDGCGNVASEQDGDLDKWWRLVRYGQDWIDEPGLRMDATIAVSSTMNFSEPIDVIEGVEVEDDDFDDFAYAPDVTLHFCKAACLALWSAQASEFED